MMMTERPVSFLILLMITLIVALENVQVYLIMNISLLMTISHEILKKIKQAQHKLQVK